MAEIASSAPVSMQRTVSVEFIRNSGGYAVAAIPGQKEPVRGWKPGENNQEKSDALLETVMDSGENLGIHLHSNIVDVDVDTDSPFIIPALDAFLPPSPHVWGRKSRPRTHRVYIVRGEQPFDPSQHPFLRRLAKIEEANVEIRGGPKTRGEYSLLPGSQHPSGEVYEWADIHKARSSPAVVDVEALLTGVRLAGAIAVLAPHWQEGTRNDMIMAVAGFFYRTSTLNDGEEGSFALNRDEARRFVEILLDVTEDDPKDRASRLKTFDRTWDKGEAGNAVTGATRIAEITGDKKIVDKLYTLLADSPDVAAIDAFVSRFAIWQGPGVVIDMDMSQAGEKSIMSKEAFLNSYGHCWVGKKLLPKMLFGMKAATRVVGLTFEPDQPSLIDTPVGKKVNQWCGFKVKPHPEPVTEAEIEPFLHYMREIIANNDPKALHWVLAWLANIFQFPAEKPKTALVLVGLPGVGKSALGHAVIMRIIGEQHSAATDTVGALSKDFNIAFDNKLYIQCDEATNSKQKAVAARLKSLITDPKKIIEPKGIDAYHKPNHSRFMFTSNEEETAVNISDGNSDRRYTVLAVPPKFKDRVKEYWDPFYKWHGDEENLAKIHRYLKDYKYDPFEIMRPYATEAKTLMLQHSWEPFDGWLAGWLARDHPLAEIGHMDWYDAPLDTNQFIDRTSWPLWISIAALERDYRSHCRINLKGAPDLLNENQLAVALKKRGLYAEGELGKRLKITEFDERKNRKVEKRVRVYPCPSRLMVEEYLKAKYGYIDVDEAVSAEIDMRRKDEDNEF